MGGAELRPAPAEGPSARALLTGRSLSPHTSPGRKRAGPMGLVSLRPQPLRRHPPTPPHPWVTHESVTSDQIGSVASGPGPCCLPERWYQAAPPLKAKVLPSGPSPASPRVALALAALGTPVAEDGSTCPTAPPHPTASFVFLQSGHRGGCAMCPVLTRLPFLLPLEMEAPVGKDLRLCC